ncbi:BAX inhibitor (BI)-1/YccA-like protein family [Acanthamoeba polyphaga moumouvirus]|uniref:BAX inhibitor (BI)-1/YccA-like protein family n=1 Tax=Acanthamoeba polyphaga moumouvirus TaxID=1269028 RepID=L7RBA8_9VIRU|nr:BAX inhibitor (BI)-1/YccA-like protein family [Acanthamoeba polyphaga moumouvirus]AGC01739.1 BAX inhibitor (BI)-1/YccA-like protein family [Acanthamoeba polyphaga moumouvirus]
MSTNFETRIKDVVWKTYLMLTISIICFLFSSLIEWNESIITLSFYSNIILVFLIVIYKNVVYLISLSFCLGITISPVISVITIINPNIIFLALVTTALIFIGLSIIGIYFNTTYDNIYLVSGIMYSCLSTIIWLSILNYFFRLPFVEIIILYSSLVIFSIYTIMDTNNLLKTSNGNTVIHAMNLFLNFANLFLDILTLIIKLKTKNKND